MTPGDVDALVARFDASGTGRVSLADFVQRIAPADFPDANARRAERRRGRVDGVRRAREKLVRTPRAPTPPPFPRRLHVAAIVALATEKMLQRTPRGWSEAKQLARAFDPAGSGTVSRASLRDALARVGLAAVSDDDADAAFARLAGDAFASTDEVPTAAFVRRALPPSYAERPARADVPRTLRRGRVDERDVRAVLSSCGVEMDEVAVGRLLRACEGEAGEGPDMARVAAAVSAPEPSREATRHPDARRRSLRVRDVRRETAREDAYGEVDDTRRRRRERWIRTRDEPKRARRHPHESRVNEGTTRQCVPPPRVSLSFDDFLRVYVTIPSRLWRLLASRALAAGKSPSRITRAPRP